MAIIQRLDPQTLFLALLGSVVPVIIWLFFWLREDNKHPEPRALIIMTFMAGIFSVVPTFILEDFAIHTIADQQTLYFSWAVIEETMKFLAAFLIALDSRFYDEPIDALVYMIVAALGFSATENFLFIVGAGGLTSGIITGSMRFIGATLLHTIASAIIGISLALSFSKLKITKIVYFLFGIGLAVSLHTYFNLFIIKDNGSDISSVFISLWLAVIFLLLFFEKLKIEDVYN